MKSQEVRLGNYYFYHIVDKYDERGEYDEVCQIDAEDFRILESFDCPEYKPIPLTKKWLLKFGFELFPWGWVHGTLKDKAVLIRGLLTKDKYWVELGNGLTIDLPYVHTLQNFFALTGEELTINKEL